MECFCLGHACWLIEAAGLRLLIDPLLGASHQRGVFTVSPDRKLCAPALRPDFVLISHAHPDHFDPPSLRALALLDPDTVVLSPDELVCWAARRLGFREARRVAAGSLIALDGVRLMTTPSAGEEEWGVLIEQGGAAAWHLVDTVLDGGDVARLRRRAAEELGLPALAERGPDLSMVRYQPLLETALALGDASGFPLRAYGRLLDAAAALGDGVVVPSSSSSVHGGRFAGMNAAVYPQTEARFLRDLGARAPRLRSLPAVPGGSYRVAPGEVTLDPAGGGALILDAGRPVDATFRPFQPPPIADVAARRPAGALRGLIDGWVRGPLCAGLRGAEGGRSFVLEVIFPDEVIAYTMRVEGGEVRCSRGFDPDYDVLDAVAASALGDVIEGDASWADVLLAGLLRASDRSYEVSAQGVRPGRSSPLFVFRGLAYEESVRRAVEVEVERLLIAGSVR